MDMAFAKSPNSAKRALMLVGGGVINALCIYAGAPCRVYPRDLHRRYLRSCNTNEGVTILFRESVTNARGSLAPSEDGSAGRRGQVAAPPPLQGPECDTDLGFWVEGHGADVVQEV